MPTPEISYLALQALRLSKELADESEDHSPHRHKLLVTLLEELTERLKSLTPEQPE